jgi:hypothetical protein
MNAAISKSLIKLRSVPLISIVYKVKSWALVKTVAMPNRKVETTNPNFNFTIGDIMLSQNFPGYEAIPMRANNRL